MEEKENFQSISDKKPLSIGQKILAGVLVFSAIIVFFFGVWQFKRSINAPFERVATSGAQTSTSEQQEDNSIIEMQNKDTDEDGLSDYEEFYIYKTSPYLADSDSDGINDKKEIDMGSSPNCPQGSDCGIIDSGSQQEVLPDIIDNTQTENKNTETDLFDFSDLNDLSGLDSLSESDLSGMEDYMPDLSNLSVSEIREMLEEAGFPSDVLDQLTDEQLLEAYKTTLENMDNEVESP